MTETVPAPVPLVFGSTMSHMNLPGLSHEVELTGLVSRKATDRRRRRLLRTYFGVSGPVVMDVIRFWAPAAKRGDESPACVHSTIIVPFIPAWPRILQ